MIIFTFDKYLHVTYIIASFFQGLFKDINFSPAATVLIFLNTLPFKSQKNLFL